jgi:hypothetical protein
VDASAGVVVDFVDLDDFEEAVFDVVVLDVVPPLLAGCVLVAAASRARTSRFMMYIKHHDRPEVSTLVGTEDEEHRPEDAEKRP